MEASWFQHDPLTFNIHRQVSALVAFLPLESPYRSLLQSCSSNLDALNCLSRLLLVPSLSLAVASKFRPILLDLTARWLHDDNYLEDKFVALCLLVQPHEELFPVLSEYLNRFVSQDGPLKFLLAMPSPEPINVSRLHRVLLAYYRLLQTNPELPHHRHWSLEPLSHLISPAHPDPGARYLAVRCYAIQSGMGEADREKLEKEVVGSEELVDCPVLYEELLDGTTHNMDCWILPIMEVKRIGEARIAIDSDAEIFYGDNENSPIQSSDLSPYIVNVHGVLMFRKSIVSSTSESPLIIPTPTTVDALRNITLRLCLRLPTLLTSAPSAGKSLLLSHLASLLHPGIKNQIITIPLADTSLDPRSLLGSYVSSSTSPGTFEWKEGILVRAMREGRWVVFADIDRGSNEVLGTIKPLIESLDDQWVGGRARLDVPSRGMVVAAEGFAIFATRSLATAGNSIPPKPSFFGAHKLHEVIVPLPTLDELYTILDAKFPRLAGGATRGFIRMWSNINALGGPGVGLRDLAKFCTRVAHLLPASHHSMDLDVDHAASTSFPELSAIFPNPTVREEMYIEARDVFFGAGTTTAAAHAHADAVAALIAEQLGLSAEQRDWVLSKRPPEFEVEKDMNGRTTGIRVGRVRLVARKLKAEIAQPTTRPFAMHRPAVMLMSRIATAVSLGEPVLLTGETGTGKTSIVTHMASLLRRPLISLNLSQQTESSDLLGGLKPVDARIPGSELQERFLELFRATFSAKKNAKFEEGVRKAVQEGKWKRAVGLWVESARMAKDRIQAKLREDGLEARKDELDSDLPRKRRKTELAALATSENKWVAFEQSVEQFRIQHVQGKGKFAFSFVEGPLVKALRVGDWILLDEINLASPETLEAVSGVLHGPTASITLTEQGSLEPVPRHPDFRLFACMNPATDVGKKDLPPNIRSRFTEIDVPPPDADPETLLSIVTQYFGASAVGDKAAIMDVAEFYTTVKKLSNARQLADGSNHKPHFSMRTLARALTFASDIAGTYSPRRALWEGCLMAFTMVLDAPSAEIVTALARKHILAGVRNPNSLLAREPSVPHGRLAEEFVKLGPFYLERGPFPYDAVDDYIMTPSVEKKLVDLARIILTRRFPVLIEGPTSSGKTSSIEYLAKRTGHRFIRINNHEHTDIQEYLGTYVSDPITGKLVFKDGLLVQALRRGDWIVLDELNLAPTDVLEALNRLLDDNRELIIPETQEVVRPHPHFMLFATQNPPGLYAGRKVLSRAFRNRFLEVHFEDVPQAELETILCQRCRIAPSYGQRIVSVFQELQKRRQSSRVFESKQGFATLRDLFRWAGRDAVGYQELAENGYMLLAERARREDDKAVVKEVIESVMKVRIDEASLYDFHRPETDIAAILGFPLPSAPALVWTKAMQRLFVLVARALKYNEPVLLVGETGSGKTSVCQVYADALNKRLFPVNCHQNTETADIIGGLRPVRNRSTLEAETVQDAVSMLRNHGITDVDEDVQSIFSSLDSLSKSSGMETEEMLAIKRKLQGLWAIFEWRDGPLVEAMRSGDVFLLDEISLADDSVLERLNSVLEPARTVVLAERGGDDADGSLVAADEGFKLVATMNPGGDYGKKELSPALRNRFTEIWVPAVDNRDDLVQIVDLSWKHQDLKPFTHPLLDFCAWLSERVSEKALLGLRDILAWVAFSNSVLSLDGVEQMPLNELFHHAARMTCLDGLASLPSLVAYSSTALATVKAEAITKLNELSPISSDVDSSASIHDTTRFVQFGAFAIPRGPREAVQHLYNLQAPTTQDNALRVVRACQVPKPILLEGSPGVGKTSLITALANICGYHLCRVNLSDQTDLADLFGSDLPVEGGGPGEFAWKDAEFLRALQEGHWVLLDEMNLAPQSVLEGLNAVLDHRGTVYVPELGRSFTRHPNFRIFAAQNPIQQGGGRKGLPKSFVNRFTKVYVETLTPDDLFQICQHMFPDYPPHWLQSMIAFNARLEEEIVTKKSFARVGAPWEFNLRDVTRWATLLRASDNRPVHPVHHLRTIYLSRFRTSDDRLTAQKIFEDVFGESSDLTNDLSQRAPYPLLSPSHVQIGSFMWPRAAYSSTSRSGRLLQSQLAALETTGVSLTQGWLVILTGPHNSGKTSLVRFMANLIGNHLHEISINSASDTTDILGSFEQLDERGRSYSILQRATDLANRVSRSPSGPAFLHSGYGASVERIRKSSSSDDALQAAKDVLLGLVHVGGPWGVEASDLLAELTSLTLQSGGGRFEWVDGPLVKALKSGHWLLLDGANLCSPSVLDRLNSLCEPGGTLVLNERGHVNGSVEIIKPHPSFRLFMSVDAQYGELSRAMRNRGIEVCLSSERTTEDLVRVHDYHRLPLPRVEAAAPGASNVAFDARRRALSSLPSRALLSYWPSGRSVEDDSTSSATLDSVSCLSTEPTLSDLLRMRDTLHAFALTTSSSAHIARFSRILPALPHIGPSNDFGQIHVVLNAFRRSVLWQVLEEYQHQSEKIWPVPFDHLSVQPFDFSSRYMSVKRLYAEYDVPSTHDSLLKALSLFVRITSSSTAQSLRKQSMNTTESSKSAVHQSPAMEEIRKATQQIDETSDALSQVTMNVLKERALMGDGTVVELALKLTVLARFLEESVTASFNFSAVQTIVKWFSEALKHAPALFTSLQRSVQALQRLVTPSSGLGLTEIWSSMLLPPKMASGHTFERLGELARSLSNTSQTHHLRSELLALMALQSLPSTGQEDPEVVQAMAQDIQKRVEISSSRTTPDTFASKADWISLIRELSILPRLHDGSGTAVQVLERMLDLACQNFTVDLRRFVPYRHAIWAAQARKFEVPAITSAYKSWLQALWDADEKLGPSLILQPTMLQTTVAKSDWSNVTMQALGDYEPQLTRHLNALLTGLELDKSRVETLTILYRQSVLMLCHCFKGTFDKEVAAKLDNMIREVPLDGITALRDLAGLPLLLQDSSHFQFKDTLTRLSTMVPQSSLDSSSPSLLHAGQRWISLFRAFVDLYVPDTPLDPGAVYHCTSQFRDQERARLSLELNLHRSLESRTTGGETNMTIIELQRKLHAVCDQAEDSASTRVTVRDTRRLREFWTEVNQFLAMVVSPSQIDSLVAQLQSGDSSADTREHVVQESISGFSQRLNTVYEDFEDISSPLQSALLHLRLGLRLVRHSQASAQMQHPTDMATSLVSSLSVQRTALLLPDTCTDVQLPGIDFVLHLILRLTSASEDLQAGVEADSLISGIETVYEQAVRLWLIDRSKEEEATKASQSLYRSARLEHDTIQDSELEEQEFLSLFPNFEDAFDKELPADEDHRPTGQFIGPGLVHHFYDLHQKLFESRTVYSNCLPSSSEMRITLLRPLLDTYLHALPESLDRISLVYQLSLTHDRLHSLHHHSKQTLRPYNFYVDPNVPELRKATDVLQSLRARLQLLILEWPEQMVLHHLTERCDQILRLSLQSPVAKVLATLEQLLVQTEDWELYANRDNNLKEHRSALISLIVEWRKLELSCWRGLLETQALEFAQGVSEWWFRLYDAILRGLLDITSRSEGMDLDGMEDYLDNLVPLLDDFVKTSPMGQFSRRLELLKSFEDFLRRSAFSRPSSHRNALERAMRILHSTHAYYIQYLPKITKDFVAQRSALEKEVAGFIKLASWKDINVQALKASAQRTHHQLYKNIRKFRDILRQPINGMLLSEKASDPDATSHFSPQPDSSVRHNAPEVPIFPTRYPYSALPAHLQDLPRTYSRYDSLASTQVETFLHSRQTHSVEALASEVISTAKNLSSLTAPSEYSKERKEKYLKTVLVRKRKAWSDLLKELKRIGFATNVKPDVLELQTKRRWLREQPIVCASAHITADVERAERYFERLCGLLPDLRAALSNHHSDLPTRELQRGVMLLESGFSQALASRTHLSRAIDQYSAVKNSARRLHMLAEGGVAVSSGPHVLTAATHIKNTICKLAKAASETVKQLELFDTLRSGYSVAPSLLEEARSWAHSADSHRALVTSVVDGIRLSSTSVLLRDEYDVLSSTIHYIEDVARSLRSWREREKHLSFILSPLLTWIESVPIRPPNIVTGYQEHPHLDADHVIDATLVIVQSLLSKLPSEASGTEDDDGYAKITSRLLGDISISLQVDSLTKKLNSILTSAANVSSNVLNDNILRFLPFVDRYLTLVEEHVTAHICWTGSLFKLLYVICTIIHTIATQGFCKLPDAEETGEGKDGGEAMGGVGLGDGDGAENVSKEIEDESQVEGLKGEDQAENKEKNKHDDDDDNAIEMGDDFEGEMEDVPDDSSQGDEGEKSGEEGEGPDEQLGDVDSTDPNAVDEKLWGDEKGPESGDDGKTNQDRSEEKGGDSELVAKEGQKPDGRKDSKSGKEEAQPEGKDGEAEEEPSPDESPEDDAGVEDPNATGAPVDDYVQDANTLELPEDLDLGTGEDVQEEGGSEEDELMDEDNEHSERHDDMDGESDTEQALGGDQASMDEGGEEDEQTTMQEHVEEPQQPEEEKSGEEAVAQPDVQSGDGLAGDPMESFNENVRDTAPTNQAGTSQGAMGQSAGNGQETGHEDGKIDDISQEAEVQDADMTGSGASTGGKQQGQSASHDSMPQDLSKNPLRSLGDAMKEIRQRFDDILEREESQSQPIPHPGNVANASQLEYLRPDDADENMQALGPAEADQVAKLSDLNIVDDETQEEEHDLAMDIDEPTAVDPSQPQLPEQSFNAQSTTEALQESVETALTRQDIHSRDPSQRTDPLHESSGAQAEVDVEEPITQDEVEAELRRWQSVGKPRDGAENIWRLYESLTHDLSYTLCEQLRLILEPTLATRLKGDYRTGKRLNMKKIIPYIASEYTKDKIWLRRTRPSQREYQVLIALDDSRSMAESHSVHLAYETLALVSKALSRLEVGDVGIAKFGEAVDVLHGFDEGPFTDQAGMQVMQAFGFQQKATNVLSLVEASLKMLEDARQRRSNSSTSAADLWQLEIIISDGICQDHEKLRTVLRKAEEQRVMVVFIVIDSLHSNAVAASGDGGKGKMEGGVQNSILSMNQVAYKMVDGKMELQMHRYLDSFPFEYYVVLRNVEALPEVLSGTLKQFFERISEE